jgi:hypothetical protein
MAIFKFSMKPDAPEKARATTVQPGPFLVDASDQEIGRRLLMANFAIVTRRLLRKRAPHPVWSEKGPSECIELDASFDASKLQQRKEVAGIDIAAWFLRRLEITSADDGRYARMLWWPCSPEDRCPV